MKDKEKSRKKILLVNPPYRRFPPFNYLISDVPCNLTLIASILSNDGWDVDVFDMPILKKEINDVVAAIAESKPDLIALSNRTSYIFPIVTTLADVIKANFPEIPTLVGGHYVSHKPEDALAAAQGIDYVAVGDADLTIAPICNAIFNKDKDALRAIKGVAFREEGTVINTGYGQAIECLDDLPLPSIHLWPLDEYVKQGRRYITYISKGCPYNCSYCGTWATKQNIRYRSAEKVFEEIKMAYDAGFRYVYFFDDLFTINQELVYSLCKLIIDAKMDLKWSCLSHVKMVDQNILNKMAEAGCDIVAFGVESGSKKVLESVGKGEQFSYIKDAFRMTKNAGIKTQAFIMFGLPVATFADEVLTFNFLQELQPDDVGVFSFTPYPGTPHFDDPDSQGMRLLSSDLSRLSLVEEPVHETIHLNREELIKFQLMANHIWRSKNSVSKGKKPRRKRDVALVKTGQGGLIYNPNVVSHKRTTDMYLNALSIDDVTFDILMYADGFHSIESIAKKIEPSFGLGYEEAKKRTISTIGYFTEEYDMLEMHEW